MRTTELLIDIETTEDETHYQALPDGACPAPSPNGGLRQLFTSVISPTFRHAQAQEVMDEAEALGEAGSPLNKAHRAIRRNSQVYNTEKPATGAVPLAALARCFASLRPGSMRNLSSTLVAGALGTGILSLPFAFSQCGLALGLATLTGVALVAALSVQVIILAARYTEQESYASLMELAVGYKWAGTLVNVTVLIVGIGAISCYLIFEGQFLPSVLAPAFGNNTQVPDRVTCILGLGLCVWPLVLSSEMSSLRYVALASPVVLLGTIALVLSQTPQRFQDALRQGYTVNLWDFQPENWLQAVSIMLGAFTNHQMAVLAGKEMDRPSVARIVKGTTNATVVSWGIYAIIGAGGYLSWLAATQGNFIENYPRSSALVWCCRALLALCLYFVIPVVCMPSARSLLQLSGWASGSKAHALSASLVLACATFVASVVSDVAAMIGILGGVCATCLMFWFPLIIFMRILFPVQPRCLRWGVATTLFVCGVVGFATIFANVRKLMGTTS